MKDKRHMRIRELVSQYEIETQEELVKALEESGFPVTQATISRDIKELQLIKVVGSNGRYKYAIPVAASGFSLSTLRRKLAEVLISHARANNLLVIKLMPGNAHAIGAMMDGMTQHGLLGTIAGDDTILVVCQDDESAIKLMALLLNDVKQNS
ncbi:arginine repressor [Alicyclobacillus tolerans]|uniref:Arginine repressor n=2 Tax=Alicyclobacillus tolerans TaxID=90970 RepID=A0A1M6U3A5_9BACL|nr:MULTISPECIES: arginine repressor [Alicyclobacillus]MDP9727961.1 transcriptional regulator of arginine metabolism [Alicyclobacillus tengchongensis]SHK63765.1 transcriptional regulator, ArgR family [Alicyclobacillus montanus]